MKKKPISKDNPPRVVVVGVGNLLLKDEGIGIHVAQALQKIAMPADVSIIDGGTSPDIIAYAGAREKLIIVDVVRGGGEPGAVYRLHLEDLDQDNSSFSVHELGVEQSLKMMALTGERPIEVVIIGIEPEAIDWGTELSARLREKLPGVIDAVLKELAVSA